MLNLINKVLLFLMGFFIASTLSVKQKPLEVETFSCKSAKETLKILEQKNQFDSEGNCKLPYTELCIKEHYNGKDYFVNSTLVFDRTECKELNPPEHPFRIVWISIDMNENKTNQLVLENTKTGKQYAIAKLEQSGSLLVNIDLTKTQKGDISHGDYVAVLPIE